MTFNYIISGARTLIKGDTVKPEVTVQSQNWEMH